MEGKKLRLWKKQKDEINGSRAFENVDQLLVIGQITAELFDITENSCCDEESRDSRENK